MEVRKKRVRNPKLYLKTLKKGEKFHLGCPILGNERMLRRVGFSSYLIEGEQILPKPVGRKSSFNANGGYTRLKHLPKETVYYQREHTYQKWAGRGRTEEDTKIIDMPYKRYQRKTIPPPSEELTIQKNKDGELWVVSEVKENSENSLHTIKHLMNLYLEIFGGFYILTEELIPPINVPRKKLNWKILPKGKYPWAKARPHLEGVMKNKSKKKAVVIEQRFETITNHTPDFMATGQGGFYGYVVFGFEDKNLFVLESLHHGNATYIFDEDWESLSKLTKAEILNENLHKKRLIHLEKWNLQITKLLSNLN